MAKIKFTKGELKRQRDALRQYNRYLPTLHLKKKQLQLEIHRQHALLRERHADEESRVRRARSWAGLLSEDAIDLKAWIAPADVVTGRRNIAGVDIPVCESVRFGRIDYDLFVVPAWVDQAVDELRAIVKVRAELAAITEGLSALTAELRTTTQRVNLFEKVKIPEAEEAIRRIKIYIGDQMANAVGRSKLAKGKIERMVAAEAAA